MDKKRDDQEPEEHGHPPDGGDEGKVHKFRFDEESARDMLETAVSHSEAEHALAQISHRALGETPLRCPECDMFCHTHVVVLRDRFMERGLGLTYQLASALELYFQNRQFGIATPYQVLNELYKIWAELSILHDMAEPQERAPLVDIPLQDQLDALGIELTEGEDDAADEGE